MNSAPLVRLLVGWSLTSLTGSAWGASPSSLFLPGASPRVSGADEAWLGGTFLPGAMADGLDLGPWGLTFGVDAATSGSCTAGLGILGAPQSAVDDWNWMATAYGRCNAVQLDSGALNVGGFVFSGLVGDLTGRWAGAGILGVTAEGGLPALRIDAAIPVLPMAFAEPWFEPALYRWAEAGLSLRLDKHGVRLGVADAQPLITYRVDLEGTWLSVTAALWHREPGARLRVGYTF